MNAEVNATFHPLSGHRAVRTVVRQRRSALPGTVRGHGHQRRAASVVVSISFSLGRPGAPPADVWRLPERPPFGESNGRAREALAAAPRRPRPRPVPERRHAPGIERRRPGVAKYHGSRHDRQSGAMAAFGPRPMRPVRANRGDRANWGNRSYRRANWGNCSYRPDPAESAPDPDPAAAESTEDSAMTPADHVLRRTHRHVHGEDYNPPSVDVGATNHVSRQQNAYRAGLPRRPARIRPGDANAIVRRARPWLLAGRARAVVVGGGRLRRPVARRRLLRPG